MLLWLFDFEFQEELRGKNTDSWKCLPELPQAPILCLKWDNLLNTIFNLIFSNFNTKIISQ